MRRHCPFPQKVGRPAAATIGNDDVGIIKHLKGSSWSQSVGSILVSFSSSNKKPATFGIDIFDTLHYIM